MKVDLPAPLSPRRQWHSPGLDGDGDTVERDHRAEVLLDIDEFDECIGHLSVLP